MSARDEMAALLRTADWLKNVGIDYHFDAIARLATDPETAPVVFRWLVEAGVLMKSGTSYCTTHAQPADESEVERATARALPCDFRTLFYGELRR